MIFNVGAGGGGSVIYLTQAEYDALPDSKLNNNVEYRIVDGNIEESVASHVNYDNSFSGLEANNVQGAVDKLNERLGECIKKYKLVKTVTTITYSNVYYYDLDISEITENALTDGTSIVSSINNTDSDGASFMYGKTLSNTKIRCFFNGSLSNASVTFNIIK